MPSETVLDSSGNADTESLAICPIGDPQTIFHLKRFPILQRLDVYSVAPGQVCGVDTRSPAITPEVRCRATRKKGGLLIEKLWLLFGTGRPNNHWSIIGDIAKPLVAFTQEHSRTLAFREFPA